MMTPAQIRAEFDRFIEFPPGSDRGHVTTTSTLLFAEHIAALAVLNFMERSGLAKAIRDKNHAVDANRMTTEPTDWSAA